ncbi:MAG: ABC transporter ATP-binding protein [Thalassobaculales bacterium]
MTQAMIAVDDLRVTFGAGDSMVHAVDGVSFAVQPGETFGLVGESGCGKSTILRALSGLNPDWSGSIRFDGQPVGARRDKAFYKFAQMVFQDPYGSLHPKHTVYTALMEPITIHAIPDGEAVIDRVLREVGLGPQFRFRYPHQLSGGQRQRVAIARALVIRPRVLLLDEPTSALDVSVQAEILNLLTEIKQAEGLTYILVSHDFGVISHMCDRIAVMNQGRILEMLSFEDLTRDRIQHDYTRRLYQASAGYSRRLAKDTAEFIDA